MNLAQIINEVNKDLDDDLDRGTIIGWVNRGLDDLSPIANYIKPDTISLIPGEKLYPKPADMIKIVQLVDEVQNNPFNEVPLDNYNLSGYKLLGSNIWMQPAPTQAKTLSLYYQATLPHLQNQDDVPVIRPDFHDLLVLYATARARYQDEEESLQNNVYNDYLTRKHQFAIECNRDNLVRTIRAIY